jgi:hypothetical protein
VMRSWEKGTVAPFRLTTYLILAINTSQKN